LCPIDSTVPLRPTPEGAPCPGAGYEILKNRRLPVWVVLVSLTCLGPTAFAEDDLQLERLRGKVVIVDFWASWCAPCRQSFPWLSAMQSKYADRGLVIIGVNVDRDRAEADRFLHDVPAGFEIVFDPDGSLAARYEVPGMPSSYVFGRDGTLLHRHIGFREAARTEREAEIQSMLRSTPGNAAL
jgi:cytochrome c biogenesis protein CcmG, thiol:disulfide interchange protein DsbE